MVRHFVVLPYRVKGDACSMSMLELVEAIEKETQTVSKMLERVKNISRDDGDILNRMDDLKALNYGAGILAGFGIVLKLIGKMRGIDLEVEA